MRNLLFLLVTLYVLAPSAPTFRSVQDLGIPSSDGLVVCTSAPGCDTGASVLALGGNAVDAAVATALAMAVTHPSAGNIGGGGFMLVRTASGEIAAFDYREKAPLKAARDMYVGADGQINRSLSTTGYLAAGVPGTVRGLELAHKRFGKLPWKDVVMPAAALAEGGFEISAGLAQSLNAQVNGSMKAFPASVAAFGKPGGGAWAAGDRLVLADLALTLRSIAVEGADVFYKGWIADRIAEDMKANGGLISREDLAAYQAKERVPVRGTYRGYEIVSMPPPSSGGVALIEMLNILEPLDLKGKGRGSVAALHLQIEAMRRAYLDRARYVGDPDFSNVPVAMLISKEHARKVAASIDRKKASSSLEMGRDIVSSEPQQPEETTHFSVIDKDGMGVTSTYTLQGGFGSKVVVKGTGFLLNNEMSDFNRKRGETNANGEIGTPANLIEPGKRMVSCMTPTIVLKDGKLVMLTGSPGGRTIMNTVLSVVLGIVEFDLNGREAVDMPRLHHQWLPDRTSTEANGFSDETLDALRAMGHDVARSRGRQGDAESIWVSPEGKAYGVFEKRLEVSKASVPRRGAV